MNYNFYMEINLSKQQYWDLIRAVYMADWMANAICESDIKQDDGIKEICDYIFSFAKEMGYEDYVEYSEELGRYFATFDLDEEPSIRSLIERYDDHCFWDEITERLGARDFFNKYSEGEIAKMNDEELFTKRLECEEKWEEEFENHGIDGLKIAERIDIGGI